MQRLSPARRGPLSRTTLPPFPLSLLSPAGQPSVFIAFNDPLPRVSSAGKINSPPFCVHESFNDRYPKATQFGFPSHLHTRWDGGRATCCGALSGGDLVSGRKQDAGLLSSLVMRGRRAILRARPEALYARFKWLFGRLRPISCKTHHLRRSCRC